MPNVEELQALDRAVAERVLGFRVETVTPSWYGNREVWLFTRPGSTRVDYSWDASSCNACMYRNGVDDTDGTADPLPGYSDNIEAAWEIVDEMIERGFLVAFDRGDTSEWFVRFTRNGVRTTSTGATPAEAICRAALATVLDT